MINVVIKDDNGSIKSIRISGHAESNKFGKDLICAAVSSISTGLLNALDELVKDQCELILDKTISIKVLQDDEKVQTILETGYLQLKTVADNNPEYVTISRKE